MGGSLGAKSINAAVVKELEQLKHTEIQVLWQCGKGYFEQLKDLSLSPNIHLLPFIERMDYAYAVADMIVSRAGATSISELTLVGKPCVLVPSPNVTEDHQTKNAKALSSINAAILVPDAQVLDKLWPTVYATLNDSDSSALLAQHIKTLALPHATEHIVSICNKLISHEP